MPPETDDLTHPLYQAVRDLEKCLRTRLDALRDSEVESEVRYWLDASGPALAWSSDSITPDEWFFITTLYGTMTLDGQATHIRTFFPRFKSDANGRIENFTPDLVADWKLRAPWMKTRLCRMGAVLRERRIDMDRYTESLREADRLATSQNPMPALDVILRDHRATEGKTLSVFVRDCVKGNCFPIDRRVAKVLRAHQLPTDERWLVSACLSLRLNPRRTARLFYAGGENY